DRRSRVCPSTVFGCGFAVEEEDVGLDALCVEDAGGQTEQGMDVGLFEQLASYSLAGAPSKRTLSGTTIAARPCCFRMVKTCWRKLSCLLLVLAQKSSRCTTSDCFSSSPASLTIVTLLFFPNGGLVSTISYSPCFPASASFTITGTCVASLPIPCSTRFILHS